MISAIVNIKNCLHVHTGKLYGGKYMSLKIQNGQSFGGVKFNTDVKGKIKSRDGQIIYSVKLPDKTVIEFPKQRGAEIRTLEGAGHAVEFNGLKGAAIQDTKKADRYELNNCENTVINAAGKKEDQDIINLLSSNKNCTVNLNKGDNIFAPQNAKVSEPGALKQGFYGQTAVKDCAIEH